LSNFQSEIERGERRRRRGKTERERGFIYLFI
jgi:hypothetical protein